MTTTTMMMHRHHRSFLVCRSVSSTMTSNNNNMLSSSSSVIKGSNIDVNVNVNNTRFFSSYNNSDPNNSSNNTRTTATNGDGVLKRTVYVHPLSQIILEYLQDCRHEWILDQGLQSLTLHRDGSFELKFVNNTTPTNTNNTTTDENVVLDNESATTSSTTTAAAAAATEDRIWTSYDEEEKKHWLTVQKSSLHQRFLLQDNLLPAWHGNRKSLPERIHLSVDNMIRAIDRLEIQQHQQQH